MGGAGGFDSLSEDTQMKVKKSVSGSSGFKDDTASNALVFGAALAAGLSANDEGDACECDDDNNDDNCCDGDDDFDYCDE